MKYALTPNYRVEFTAFAPMHTFKAWCMENVTAEVEIDFDTLSLHKIHAVAKVSSFTTGDALRNQAMWTYMVTDRFAEASIEMTKCKEFIKLKSGAYRVSVLTVLEFMGIRRQLPITFYAVPFDEGMKIETAFNWSFKAFGLKPPRLLFLTVRDSVEIKGWGHFEKSDQTCASETSKEAVAIPG